MKRTLIITVILFCALYFTGISNAYTWYSYNGHTYTLTSSATWTAAEAEAVTAGGHLVTINDAAEEAWLVTTFGRSYMWIGFTDQASEGNWVWVSGESVTYTNWNGGEPNDYYGEDYAVINWNGVKWNDLNNSYSYYGIIEKTPVPLPTSMLLLTPALTGLWAFRKRFFC